VREGSTPYILYAYVSADGISEIVFLIDIDDSLWKDDAYLAIIRDLGYAFIRAAATGDATLVKNIGDYRRCLDGYKSGGSLDAVYELYGKTAYFMLKYTKTDDGSPDYLSLAYFVYPPS